MGGTRAGQTSPHIWYVLCCRKSGPVRSGVIPKTRIFVDPENSDFISVRNLDCEAHLKVLHGCAWVNQGLSAF